MLSEKLANDIAEAATQKLTEKTAGKLGWIANKLKRPLMLTGLVGGAGYLGNTLTDPKTGHFDVNRAAALDHAITSMIKDHTTQAQRDKLIAASAAGLGALRSLDASVFNTGAGLNSLVMNKLFGDKAQNYEKRFSNALYDLADVPKRTNEFKNSALAAAKTFVPAGLINLGG